MPYAAITQVHLAAKSPFWDADGLPANTWTDALPGRFFVDKGTDGTARFLCWVNGAEAKALDRLGDKSTGLVVLRELARPRPSTKGQLEVLKAVSWANNPFAEGAYHHLVPGQAAKFYPTILQPVNRLHFAGEHAALLNNGMEAAMESAERAVGEVVNESLK